MTHPISMLSFIQNILSRPHSPSSTAAGRKRKRSTSSATATEETISVNATANERSTAAPQADGSNSEMAYDRDAAIASFLALPDGPLVKRVKRGDGNENGVGFQGKSGRLSVICEVVEEDGQGGEGPLGCMEGKRIDGWHEVWSHEGEDKDKDMDVEMEDVELGRMCVDGERGLWTYRGGNSFQR